jgi:hypothetical protein
MALAGVQDEVGEAEKLMIDPSLPFNFSHLPAFVAESVAIQ